MRLGIHTNLKKAALAATILAGMGMFAGQAAACTLTNWTSSTGAIEANNPNGDNSDGGVGANIQRYSGECGMVASTGGYVADTSPSAEARVVTRFYVDVSAHTGTSQVFVGYSDDAATTAIMNISYNGTSFTMTTPGGSSAAIPAQAAWNSIEFDWNTAANTTDVIVNGGAPVSFAAGSGALESVRLGHQSGGGGSLGFDAYEMHRSTAVGRLIACDANADGSSPINVLDALAGLNEINAVGLAPGQPDCTEDSAVNVLDILEMLTCINGGGGCQ